MKKTIGKSVVNIVLVVASLSIGSMIGEGFLRVIVPSRPSFDEVIGRSLQSPERLFSANVKVVYSIEGLYSGVNQAVLRTGGNRFIEPEPQFSASHRVLFLGGSSTEGIYVPEDGRWVALLNKPGELAAYNAGQSGANTLDEYFTFLYLSREKAVRFDLVVLMTVHNDWGWQRRLTKHGGALRLPEYHRALKAWYIDEYRRSETLWDRLRQKLRLFDVIGRANNRIRQLSSSPQDPSGSVVAVYRKWRDDTITRHGRRTIPLSECQSYPEELEHYAENARRNVSLLADAVSATGAKFLVLSESNSFLAPSASFHEDFRQPLTCDDSLISNGDAYILLKELNRRYLQAAHEAGALTFDLAAAMDRYANGPDGGRFMYDSSHYTADGCAKVASLLYPVIVRILAKDL